MLNNNSLQVYLKLFDAQVQPIAQYGAELWGLDKAAMHIEKVHLFALKKFLGVHMRTPNDLVYGETGRYPIYLNSCIRCTNYWLKIVRMEENRLPYKAYKMLSVLDARGKKTWVSGIRETLYKYGFGYVWLNQGVENINGFLKNFRQRLIDCRWQNWDDHIQSSDRFSLYRTFKSSSNSEMYLLLNMNRHIKCSMTRFRFGISDIAVHHNRYKNVTDDALKCPLCKHANEDDVHFLLCCPAFSDLRQQFIPPKFYENPCLFRMTLLLAKQNENVLKNLCIYVYKAFKRRSNMLV